MYYHFVRMFHRKHREIHKVSLKAPAVKYASNSSKILQMFLVKRESKLSNRRHCNYSSGRKMRCVLAWPYLPIAFVFDRSLPLIFGKWEVPVAFGCAQESLAYRQKELLRHHLSVARLKHLVHIRRLEVTGLASISVIKKVVRLKVEGISFVYLRQPLSTLSLAIFKVSAAQQMLLLRRLMSSLGYKKGERPSLFRVAERAASPTYRWDGSYKIQPDSNEFLTKCLQFAVVSDDEPGTRTLET